MYIFLNHLTQMYNTCYVGDTRGSIDEMQTSRQSRVYAMAQAILGSKLSWW